MALMLDANSITHGIQLSVAPVFLLTAVSGLIGAVAGRLARIIDRARQLEDRIRATTDQAALTAAYRELTMLRKRGHLANASIGLLTLCAVFIGLTIIVLFLGETIDLQASRSAVAGFLAGVACFVIALVCFLVETVIATRVLDFPTLRSE